MQVQRNRVYELIVGDSKSGDALLINNSLQVTFDISKSSSNKDRTNSAAIEITNLSNESLKLLDVDYPAAVFSAGYLEIGMKRLFAGQITNVTTRKSGTDRVTQIQMGAGYTDLNHTVLSQLTAPGRTVKDVLEDIRKAIPNVSRGVFNGTNLNNPVIYGYPLMGTPKEMLDELSSKYGLHWQVDEDVLYVHDNDRANTENFEQAYVISKYTGLIENAYRVSGDVRRGAKDKSKKQGVQLKMLLNPDIIPGDIVKLEDTLITGWFKVDSMRHTGGWRDSGWYSELQLSALEKVENKKE
jgi:hypothetical protein